MILVIYTHCLWDHVCQVNCKPGPFSLGYLKLESTDHADCLPNVYLSELEKSGKLFILSLTNDCRAGAIW